MLRSNGPVLRWDVLMSQKYHSCIALSHGLLEICLGQKGVIMTNRIPIIPNHVPPKPRPPSPKSHRLYEDELIMDSILR